MSRDQSWRKEAACLGLPVNLFFPHQKADAEFVPREIIRICADCPVREECLDYALRMDQNVGLWAGTTPGQRAVIRQRTGITVEKPVNTAPSTATKSTYGTARNPARRASRRTVDARRSDVTALGASNVLSEAPRSLSVAL